MHFRVYMNLYYFTRVYLRVWTVFPALPQKNFLIWNKNWTLYNRQMTKKIIITRKSKKEEEAYTINVFFAKNTIIT